jgi:hypothetical protein
MNDSGSRTYEYGQSVVQLSHASTRAVVTGGQIGSAWRLQQHSAPDVVLLDVGCGNGVLTLQALRSMNAPVERSMITLVDPDSTLLEAAAGYISAAGYAVLKATSLDSLTLPSYSHVIASHVLYYLKPFEQGLRRLTKFTAATDGHLALVIRDESCDTYALRSITRRYEGSTRLLDSRQVIRRLEAAGYSVEVDVVPAQVVFAADQLTDGLPTEETELDQFVRWMMRLPLGPPFAIPIADDLGQFLAARTTASGVGFSLRDLLILAKR